MGSVGGLDSSKIIVIDTETTGLKAGNDEVLSLSILDGDGNVLFNDLIKPARRKRWPKAAEINGITWNDVKDKPTLAERRAEIVPLFERASLVVGYNVKFDLGMLEGNGLVLPEKNIYDVMEWHAIRNGGRRVKLVQCASEYGYEFVPHSALEDTKATLHCLKAMVGDYGLAGVGQEKKPKRRFLWLALSTIAFVIAIILIIATSTAVTSGGIVRGVIWTVVFAVLGFVGVVMWRRS